MRIQEMLQAAFYTFNQQNDNTRFNHDFYLSLNESQDEFANYRNWGCLRTTGNITTVADTQTADLFSDFGSFYNVRGAHRITSPTANVGDKVDIVSVDQQFSRSYTGTTTGTPDKAWVMGSSIYFSPIPDAAYIIAFLYYKRPTAVDSGDNDIDSIPAKYHELIKRMVFKRLQENGYTSDKELAITDVLINRYLSQAIKDDIASYGGPVMALYDDSYVNNVG